MERLKKCPFCGSEAEVFKAFELGDSSLSSDRFTVKCRSCFCGVGLYSDSARAVETWNTRKPMEWYEELESKLQSLYGECDGFLETVVDGVVERLVKHEGVQFEKLNKAFLLTDENVEKWKRLEGAKERIVERLEDNSFWTEPTYDMDGHSNEDETEVINLQKAVEIVKEEM